MFAEKRANVLVYNFKFWNFHLEYFKILAHMHMFLTLCNWALLKISLTERATICKYINK